MSLLRNLALAQRLGTSTVEARSSLEEPGRDYSHRGGPAWAEGDEMIAAIYSVLNSAHPMCRRCFQELFPFRGSHSSRLLADPHHPGCGGGVVTADFGRIALTLDAGREALG